MSQCKVPHSGEKNQHFTQRGPELSVTDQERDLGVLLHKSVDPKYSGGDEG